MIVLLKLLIRRCPYER